MTGGSVRGGSVTGGVVSGGNVTGGNVGLAHRHGKTTGMHVPFVNVYDFVHAHQTLMYFIVAAFTHKWMSHVCMSSASMSIHIRNVFSVYIRVYM